MAQDITSKAILATILPVLQKMEAHSLRYEESLAALQCIYDYNHGNGLVSSDMDDGSYRNMFHLFATCLNDARIQKSDHLGEAFAALADASRDPKWRRYLGKCDSHSIDPGWPPDPKHNQYAYSHEKWSSYESECVLQVAVRTLHPRHIRHRGQAGYHALRLISNCCADNDENKRVVLECGGIELLLRCANLKLWPEIITAALWNICAECEFQSRGELECAIVDDSPREEPNIKPVPNMSTIACTQLALRSTSECDDSAGKSLLTAELEDGRRQVNIVKELLDLAEIVSDIDRKEMLAELLEKASSSISRLYDDTSETVDKNVPGATRLILPDLRSDDFMSELLTGAGRRLALTSPECNCDMTRTIAILVLQADIKTELIHKDLVRALLQVANWQSATFGDDEPARLEMPSTMPTVRHSMMKSIYDVTASPQFIAKHDKGVECTKLVEACIDALGDASKFPKTKNEADTILPAPACVVLANITRTAPFASFLVQQKSIHLYLSTILRQRDDPTTLFPAIALLDRLAIPPENKKAIFSAGVIDSLPRILNNFDIQPRIQCEAIGMMRKIIAGHPNHVSAIGICVPFDEGKSAADVNVKRTLQQSGLLAALKLFDRTNDIETKIEIGRLIVEICRTLLRSTRGRLEIAEGGVSQSFSNSVDIAKPITYLICNGTSHERRGEGWFGLAVLSNWNNGRPIVMECLAVSSVQEKLEERLNEGEHALCQNISLMLSNLHLFPSRLVIASIRDILERAASKAALPPIWPVLAQEA